MTLGGVRVIVAGVVVMLCVLEVINNQIALYRRLGLIYSVKKVTCDKSLSKSS